MSSERGFATKALHTTLPKTKHDGSLALAPTISTSAVYRTPVDYVADGSDESYMYGRYGNPSREGVEAVIAALEGATDGFVFSSGMASINAVVETLQMGDHVVASKQMYGGAYNLFRSELAKVGIDVTFVDDVVSVENVKSALRPETKMVWMEVVTNPLISIMDVAKMADIVHGYNKEIIFGIDNTFLTPYILRPLEHGADIVMHSGSKFLGGHSDLIMGVLATSHSTLAKKLRDIQRFRGAVPSAFDSYLLHRSLQTLEVRVMKHHENSLKVATFLESHPGIEKVIHPLLASHPSLELAKTQNGNLHTGVFAFYIKGNMANTKAFMSKLKLVVVAPSLGGVHSSVSVPALLSHVDLTPEERRQTAITENLLRISVGLEKAEDLMEDLDQALNAAV